MKIYIKYTNVSKFILTTESQFNSKMMSYICDAAEAILFGGFLCLGCYINTFTRSQCSETEI